MKKIIVAILLCFGSTAYSQKLVKNEVDRFTKHSEKLTSWETLKMGLSQVAKVRAKSVNDSMALRFSYASPVKPFIIMIDAKIYLLLQNNESVILPAIGTAISQPMGNAQYAEAVYHLSSENAKRLLASPLKAIRIDMNKEYIELDIKEKNSTVVQDVIKLLL